MFVGVMRNLHTSCSVAKGKKSPFIMRNILSS